MDQDKQHYPQPDPNIPIEDPNPTPDPKPDPPKRKRGNPQFVKKENRTKHQVGIRLTDSEKSRFDKMLQKRKSKLGTEHYTPRNLVLDMMQYLSSDPWGDFYNSKPVKI